MMDRLNIKQLIRDGIDELLSAETRRVVASRVVFEAQLALANAQRDYEAADKALDEAAAKLKELQA